MSRSIHATGAALERERAMRWSDPGLRRKRLREVARALATKRCIKEEVRRERALGDAAPAVPLDPDAIPVRIVDHGPSIHYSATEADVRAICRALPPGTLDGLAEIELLLGSRAERPSTRQLDLGDIERDPTGRYATELLPGVFEGLCLGVYSPSRARIRLFAYVYDPALPERAAVEPYLKLRMLSTLVHEIAHHFDHRRRIARGLWRADDAHKVETYADAREHEWVHELVVPYVLRAHAPAVSALDRWMTEHLGVSLDLGLLASNCSRQHLFGDVGSAFKGVLFGMRAGQPRDETRVQFARDLHYIERNDLTQRVLDALLAAEPQHPEALALRAKVVVQERRFTEADTILRGVLARDARCLEAWRVLADLESERRDWRGLLAAASRGAELSEAERLDRRRVGFVAERARALLELGEHEALATDVAELIADRGYAWRARGYGFRAIALLRTGRLAEALATADEGLLHAQRSTWRHELLAVRFEAGRALHPSRPLDALLPETLENLRHRGFEDWAERLGN